MTPANRTVATFLCEDQPPTPFLNIFKLLLKLISTVPGVRGTTDKIMIRYYSVRLPLPASSIQNRLPLTFKM